MKINADYGAKITADGIGGTCGASGYSKYLTDKYKCLTPCRNASVAVAGSLLRKAAGDKKTAERLEENLSAMPDVIRKAQQAAAARGSRLVSVDVKITDEGTEMATWTVSDTEGTDNEIDKWLERIENDKKDKKIHPHKRTEARRTDTLTLSDEAEDAMSAFYTQN